MKKNNKQYFLLYNQLNSFKAHYQIICILKILTLTKINKQQQSQVSLQRKMILNLQKINFIPQLNYSKSSRTSKNSQMNPEVSLLNIKKYSTQTNQLYTIQTDRSTNNYTKYITKQNEQANLKQFKNLTQSTRINSQLDEVFYKKNNNYRPKYQNVSDQVKIYDSLTNSRRQHERKHRRSRSDQSSIKKHEISPVKKSKNKFTVFNSKHQRLLFTPLRIKRSPEKQRSLKKMSDQLKVISKQHFKYKQLITNHLNKGRSSVCQEEQQKKMHQNSLEFTRLIKFKHQSSIISQNKGFSDSNFKVLKKIGQGTFAKVYSAIDRKTGFLVTLKKIMKNLYQDQKFKQRIITQIKIQSFLNHPNIVKMYGFYIQNGFVTFILQHMQSGSLYQKMKSKKCFPEKQSSRIIGNTLYALKYIHKNKIIHRDIKPDNILLTHNVTKICDFGTAAICTKRRSTICGTLDYTSPEIFEGKQYGSSIDLWSIGILCYEILTGKPPFFRVSKKDTIKEISQFQDHIFQYPSHISLEAINFVSKFIIKDPDQRISIQKAMNLKFIRQNVDLQTQDLRLKLVQFQ